MKITTVMVPLIVIMLSTACTMQKTPTPPAALHRSLPASITIEASSASANDRATLIYKLHIDLTNNGYAAVSLISPAAAIDERALPVDRTYIDDIISFGKSISLTGVIGDRGEIRYLAGGGERIDMTYDTAGRMTSRTVSSAGKKPYTCGYTYDDRGRIIGYTRSAPAETVLVRYAALDGGQYRDLTRQYAPLAQPWQPCIDAIETLTRDTDSGKTITSFRYNGLKAEVITVNSAGKELSSDYFTFDAVGAILEKKSYLADAEYLAVSTVSAGKTIKTEHYHNGAMTHFITIADSGDTVLERVCTPEGRAFIERRITIVRR